MDSNLKASEEVVIKQELITSEVQSNDPLIGFTNDNLEDITMNFVSTEDQSKDPNNANNVETNHVKSDPVTNALSVQESNSTSNSKEVEKDDQKVGDQLPHEDVLANDV